MAYKILSDSNIDWGQNKLELYEYLKKNKDAIYEPKYPTTGTVVVRVNLLTGVFEPKKYSWLRGKKPTDHIAYSYLVYEIGSVQ